MEGDCNVYAHSSLWMRPTRPDRYNMRMVYMVYSKQYCDFLSFVHRNLTQIQVKGGRVSPLMTAKKLPKIGKKSGKIGKKEENIGKVLSLCLWQIGLATLSGGGTQLRVGHGCAARSFDHHPITKPEKTQICNLCLNHLFLEGPFLKPISTFYHVNWDA